MAQGLFEVASRQQVALETQVHLPYAQNRMVLGGYRERTPGVTVPMQRARVIFHDNCCKLDGPIVCVLASHLQGK